jgi:ethanolamine ammonia-lyase small subunit
VSRAGDGGPARPRWAKAPEHRDPEGSAAEAREFLEAGLTPVRCDGCASEVGVRKASAVQTSVQWRSDPARTCPAFAARVAAGEPGARVDTCPTLRESIEHAVADGVVVVPGA